MGGFAAGRDSQNLEGESKEMTWRKGLSALIALMLVLACATSAFAGYGNYAVVPARGLQTQVRQSRYWSPEYPGMVALEPETCVSGSQVNILAMADIDVEYSVQLVWSVVKGEAEFELDPGCSTDYVLLTDTDMYMYVGIIRGTKDSQIEFKVNGIYGPDNTPFVADVGTVTITGSPEELHDPENPTGPADPTGPVEPTDPAEPAENVNKIEQVAFGQLTQTEAGGRIWSGMFAGDADNFTTVKDLLLGVKPKWQMDVTVTNADGSIPDESDPACTGQIVDFVDRHGKVHDTATVVISGDVNGSGIMNLAQLVTLVAIYTGAQSVDPIYEIAADWNVDGSLGVGDLVRAADGLRGHKPEAEHIWNDIITSWKNQIQPPVVGQNLHTRMDPTISCNWQEHQYDPWGKPVRSYLQELPEGGYERAEYLVKDNNQYLAIEKYDADFKIRDKRLLFIDRQMPYWGGLFFGDKYNFVIIGCANPKEDLEKETVRVIKYDKNWNELGSGSSTNTDVSEPFTWASMRCAETNGTLYIRTGTRLFPSSSPDNYSHQNAATYVVRESDMRVQCFHEPWISHDNNQYVIVDKKGRLVFLDHGDHTPTRAAWLSRVTLGDESTLSHDLQWPEGLAVSDTWGHEELDQWTGAAVGGLAETSEGYVTTYSYNGTGEANLGPRDVYLSFVSEDMLARPGIKKLTRGDVYCTTPVLVSTGLDGGYLMWMEMEGEPALRWDDENVDAWRLRYTKYDAKGYIGEIYTDENAALSDCQPIVTKDGKIVWYTTFFSKPVFYTLDGTGIKAVEV